MKHCLIVLACSINQTTIGVEAAKGLLIFLLFCVVLAQCNLGTVSTPLFSFFPFFSLIKIGFHVVQVGLKFPM